uniref:beta strand repeat-containing protein n=1 Tax=Cognatilysobacter terrigena TaxID=2488749 RepID=UPI00105B814C
MTSSNSHRGLTVGVLFAAMAQVLWPMQAAAQSTPLGTINSIVGNGGGSTTVTSGPSTVTITPGNTRTLVNWNTFNVSGGQTYNVVFGGPGNLIVNRVVGGTPTTINGNVASYFGTVGGPTGGNVWILNPNGVAVGSTGRFDVGGLLLSTMDLADADIMDNDLRFNFSGVGGTGVSVATGAVLNSTAGGATLVGDAVSASGAFASSTTNTLVSARNLTVDFDASLGAVTTLTINTGSGQGNGVIVGAGAAFSGTRNVLMASGMSNGQGNVLLANAGGANDIRFNSGSVELISRDANVVAQGVFATPGNLTVDASAGMFQGNGGPTVGGNYSITARDFSGGVFQPTFVGGGNNFSITDTQGGLVIGNVVAPGDLSVTTTNGDLIVDGTFGSPGSQNGNVYLTSSGAITLNGAVTTSSAPGHSIWLNAGTSINQTGSAITTGSLFASATTGISLQRAANYWGTAQFTNTSSGDVSATATTAWQLLGATSAGGLYLGGTSIGVAGNVLAIGDMAFNSNVVLNGNTTMQSNAGSGLLGGTVDGNGGPTNVTVNAANGATFSGNVGATTALSSLTVNGAAQFNGGSVRTTGAIDLDAVTLGAVNPFAFNSTGGSFYALSVNSPTSVLQVTANGIQIGDLTVGDYNGGVFRSAFLNAGAGAITLGNAYTGALQANAGSAFTVTGALDTIRLSGTVGGAATLSGNNHINSIGPFSSNGLVVRDLNSLTVDNVVNAGSGDVRIEVVGDNLQIDAGGQISGRDVALSSNTFFNQSGNDGVVASGHWVIYQQFVSPFALYDGLDSGQTALWGKTITTAAPSSISGNRYVFATTPTLTFTTTDTTKTYGTDLTGSAGSFYTVTGFQSGVAGAYLGDTAASAFTGAPTVTSGGFATRAAVAGGPYAINIVNGSLASTNGYNFAFNGTGKVTVNQKALTGTPTATTKTYDGTTNGSGTIALSGLVAGDTVGATGTFTFLDKNAGVGKTVNITGATLNGVDAGNYTLTLPASTIGDILQKA